MPNLKTAFICGTGRCGTTITKKVLSAHPAVFSFKDEARFLDCPHGIISLYRALTQSWTPLQADTAIQEFEHFLFKRPNQFMKWLHTKVRPSQSQRWLYGHLTPPQYLSLDLRGYQYILKTHYNELQVKLEMLSYPGCWPGSRAWQLEPKIKTSTLQSANAIAEALRLFVFNFMSDIMRKEGGEIWLDDSIYTHLLAEDVRRLLPLSKFIHIYRNPFDVVSSYQTQLWAPHDPLKGARLYASIMERWGMVKKNLPADSYIELKFEQIIENPRQMFDKICSFLNIEPLQDVSGLTDTQAHIGRHKQNLPKDILKEIEIILNPYVNLYSN